MKPVVPVLEQIAGLNDHISRWQAAGQVLHAHLYKNNFSPSPTSVLADFTEVLVGDFPGYAPITVITSGTPFIDGTGAAQQVWSDPVFQPSADPAVPLTVFGYFITLHPVAGADTLLYGVRFSNPPTVLSATDAVKLDPDTNQVAFSSPDDQ
jgi:hypothetical protein